MGPRDQNRIVHWNGRDYMPVGSVEWGNESKPGPAKRPQGRKMGDNNRFKVRRKK
jgi:hypothetical protein